MKWTNYEVFLIARTKAAAAWILNIVNIHIRASRDLKKKTECGPQH